MSKRRVTNIAGIAEIKPGKRRRVTNIAGIAEIKPGKRRRITNIAGVAEIKPGKRRRVTNIALMLETELGACVHDGPCTCPLCHETGDANSSGNPISLRLGEKREEITDLVVNTPAGALSLTRSYRQRKQGDASYQFMGLGWTHSHQARLIPPVDDKIVVRTPGAGEVVFFKSTTDTYPAAPGSTSVVTYNPGTQQYTLTASDKSTYVFDSAGVLLSRRWPSGETWTYAYDNGKLIEVDDGYDRKLVFRYIESGAHAGQVHRVGDHTFDDTDPENLIGRYVEYGYSFNKVVDSSGAIVDGTDSLLTGVYDVRGKLWTYNYYVESGPAADVRQLNFLIARQSPPLNGMGSEITLEENSYTMQGDDLAVNGSMEANSDWTAVGSPTHGQSSGQVYAGSFAWHVDAADGGGIEGNAWNLRQGRTYIVTARVYPVSGTVKMQVSGETEFDRLSTGTSAWETLRAVYSPSADANGRTLQFVADGGAAEFYVDDVTILESDLSVVAITQQRGDAALSTDYSFQPGQDLTTEVRAGLETRHRFRNGVYLGTEDPEGNYPYRSVDWNYRPKAQVDANNHATWLEWSSDGKHLLNVNDALGHETAFTYDTSDRLTQSLDAQGRKTTYTYGDANNPRLPTIIKVFDTDGTTVLRWQTFSYDTMGRPLTEQVIDPADGTTVLQEVVRAYHASGDGEGLLQTVTQADIGGLNDVTTTYTYDSAGRVVQTQQSSNFGSCEISYTVYDAAGNVVASICNYAPGMNPDPTDAIESAALYDEQNPDINRVTTHDYDALGRRVSTTINAGATFAQTTVTVYDGLDRVVRTVTNFVDDSYAAPAGWVFENGVWKDGPGGTTISHGADNTQNIIADTDYNDRGQVRFQRDVLGNVTLLGYDDAGRLVKTVQNASDPAYNNNYSGTSPDPDLSGYTPVTDADRDILTEQVYDAVGNLVQTVDPLGRVSFTVYDALNRPVKVVRNANDEATIALNPGDVGYDDTDDPRSANYAPSTDPDRDHIETTEYDAMGRVIRVQRLLENRGPSAVWDTTFFLYDSLGRQIKTVRSASNGNYDVAADPDLSGYTFSDEPDEDIITQTVYDDNGRTLYTQDTLDVRTWFGYDGLGRGVKTIQSAVGTATDDSVNDPRSVNYIPSSEPDEDLITRTVYNDDGRLQQTEDVLGNVTYFVYDEDTGRQLRTIQNYVAQGATDPKNWVWSVANERWEDGASNPIDHGTDNDQNILSETAYEAQGRVASTFDHRHNETRFEYDALGRRVTTIQNYGDGVFSTGTPDEDVISTTEYDVAGRVISTTDNAGIETRFAYDHLGRRVTTIQNYVDGVFSSAAPDEDLISTTDYNKAGQVVSTADPRGTQTAFTYDVAGRRLTVIQAAGTSLEAVSYTCYDKAGRVLRTIQNWIDDETSPDAQDGSGGWLFAPTAHGQYDDENLITEYRYDAASRREQVVDPVGNETTTAYDKGGQVVTITDAEAVDTAYRYDKVRRRTRVVQTFVDNGEDPAAWVWDATDDRWEESDGTAIEHGAEDDTNIIVQVGYDKAGRMLSLRDPNGHETTYAYDNLGRRLTLTNPLSIAWETAYSDLPGGGTQTTQTMPGINGGSAYTVQRDFDRLGRLASIQYGDPANTPNVAFGYDAAGNRVQMTEYGGASFTSPVRETLYGYDDVRRLTSVGFDHDADSTVDETVSYEYDAGGLRTKLTLPGGTDSITYVYDAKGQLVKLSDWDGHHADFHYDDVGRHIATVRSNRLTSDYRYDPAGRLQRLRHLIGTKVRSQFIYEVDGRGNRTQAYEYLAQPSTVVSTYDKDDQVVSYPQGTWTDSGDFKQSTDTHARMEVAFTGDEAVLTYGVGPDHSIFDVYINDTLWESFDGYAASVGEKTVNIQLVDGSHVLEIRNRVEKNAASSGYKVQFKQLQVLATTYVEQNIQYTYDALSRLQQANYDSEDRVYDFNYDRVGNRLAELLSGTGVTPTDRYFGYNAANQMIAEGDTLDMAGEVVVDYTYEYDANGNLLYKKDTVPTTLETYTWDRANRLLTAPGTASYQYDGNGNRIQRTVSSVVTDYLLDTQPGLAMVLQQTTNSNVDRFIYSPRGIHAHQDNGGDWFTPVQDGLGSVRGVADDVLAVQGMRHYAPYGTPFGAQGSLGIPFGFTGEQTDANELVYLRARYLNPRVGAFVSLDPFEGIAEQPMSLNGFNYVEGNPVNRKDITGLQSERVDSPCIDFGLSGDWRGYSQCIYNYKLYEQGLNPCPSGSRFSHIGDYGTILCSVPGQTDPIPAEILWAQQADFWLSQVEFEPFTIDINVGGYIEGIAGSGSYIFAGSLNGQGGIEVVYNFSTFQREMFSFFGVHPFSTLGQIASVSLVAYAGHVQGFTENPNDPTDFVRFESQYEGDFIVSSGSISVPPSFGGPGASVGITTFASPPSTDPTLAVKGSSVALSLGISLGFGFEVIHNTLTYQVERQLLTPKHYIDQNCQVRTGELVGDILLGIGSPLGLSTVPPVGSGLLPIRIAAAVAAADAANQYNLAHVGTCSCKGQT